MRTAEVYSAVEKGVNDFLSVSVTGLKRKLRRLSTVGFHGYTLALVSAYTLMVAPRSEWQIMALLALVARK
jgi:hypothetical protein